MDLIHEVNLAVLLSEFVLGVNKDKTHLGCDFGSSLEDGLSVSFELFVVLFAYDALSDNLLF